MTIFDWLAPYLLAPLPFIAIIITFFLYPEKVERWSSLFTRLFSSFSDRAERATVARDIQGRIGEFKKSLGPSGDIILPYGLKVKWISKGEAEAEIHEGDIIVVLKEHTNPARNFLTALLSYLPQGLLPKSRTYADKVTMRAIDLTVARKIIMEKRLDALAIFEKEILDAEFKINGNLCLVIQSLTNIDDKGLLTRIFLPEVAAYGTRIWPSPARKADSEPIEGLFKVLSDLAAKLPGVDSPTPFAVNSENLNVCVVPVAKMSTVARAGTDPHLKFVRTQARNGIKNFYVLSSLYNRPIASSLVDRMVQSGSFQLDYKEDFRVRRGKAKEVFIARLQLLKPIE